MSPHVPEAPAAHHLLLHELRTPLAAVLGLARLIREFDGPVLPPRVADWLAHIELAGHHMLHLCDGLGGRPPEAPDADLAGSLCESLRLLRVLARQGRVQLALSTPLPDEVPAAGSAATQRQVLLNVIGNAIKYTPPDGRVEVALRRCADSSVVCITVRDNGIGMSAEQLAHLFEPWQRLGRESSAVAGSGLGLYASRQLVRALGGSFEVASEVGRGTSMTLRWPVLSRHEAAAAAVSIERGGR